MHRIKRAVLIIAAAALVAVVCAPVASAETTAPWWGLSTGARPTNLGASSGKNEVQRLRVKATEGDYALKLEFGTGKQEMERQRFALVPFNASAAEIREAIEHPFNASTGAPPCAINPGEASCAVTVTEEASGEANTRLFKIVFLSEVVALEGIPFTLEPGGEAVTTELEKGARSENQIIVYAENLGNAPTSGKVTLADQLPAGLTPTSMSGHVGGTGRLDQGPLNCELKTLTCTFEKNHEEGPGSLPPFEVIEMRINVQVGPGASNGAVDAARVSGGGASGTVSAQHPIAVGTPQRFGVEDYSLVPEQQGGLVDTQAGSHPFQLTSTITLNTQAPDHEHEPRTAALPKDISSELPPGLVGNAIPLTQCTDTQFEHQVNAHEAVLNECPAASAVGVATVTFAGAPAHLSTLPMPIFNMVPLPGEPVRFGFKVTGLIPVFLDTSVRTGSDYGVTVSSHNIIQAAWLLGTRLTFWGVPGDPAHDQQRGWKCLLRIEGSSGCPAANATSPPPFLSMPTSCAAPFESPIRANSWAASGKPSEVAEALTYHLPEALDGCNHLPFAPSIRVISDGSAASAPTGVNVDVHVPQDSVLNTEGLAESAAKDISVTLPAGMAINPSGGNGLQACPEGLVGFTGFATLHGQETATFTPALPAPLQPGANFCPDASKVGTVKIKVPIIANPLEGSIYLASQNENPFGSLIAMYIVAEDPVSGVLVKLPGEVRLSPAGQITGTFHNSPQAPFEDAELHFFGGERAPLATPARCGSYTTNASLTPWSGNGPVGAASTFNITSGPGGGPCPGAALPFSPSLTGGTTNINAGAFSQLTTTIGRADGQQNMQSVTLHMPAGLSGLLSGVKLCPEQNANEGTCGPESLIGETTVSAGVGSDPVSVKGGRVYITEHYAGSPFGLSIVNPVKAGPFDLEHDTSSAAQQPACDCVVVRARIDVDQTTAALTITTDSSGAHAIPHLIDGVPVQIQKVNVIVNRPGFTFNPTNCNPMAITGSIASDEGASSPVSVPFQVTNCAVLKFAPKFSVSTNAKTSKAQGASLTAKLAEPPGAMGSQANIAKVKVDLPKQLPSRLTTLQKACTNAQFVLNPANCPAASKIGHAKVITPLLPVPLEGPAIFVSHGGESFPSLTMVLQGYGVTVDLVGTTFISKAGVTSTTFKTVPDAPFETFELTLPQGRYSALAANGNLCTAKLVMPSEFLAQNGAKISRSTKISVTGCAKHKVKRARRRGGHRGRRKPGRG